MGISAYGVSCFSCILSCPLEQLTYLYHLLPAWYVGFYSADPSSWSPFSGPNHSSPLTSEAFGIVHIICPSHFVGLLMVFGSTVYCVLCADCIFVFVLFCLVWFALEQASLWVLECFASCFSGFSSLALVATAFLATLDRLHSHCTLGKSWSSLEQMFMWVLTSVRYTGSQYPTS